MDPTRFPMGDYVTKLLLLEAARCYAVKDPWALVWIQDALWTLSTRWRELEDED